MEMQTRTVPVRSVARRHVPREEWDAFVEAHEDGWFFHTNDWVDYAVAYTPGSRDVSTAVVDDEHHIVGIGCAVVGPDGAMVYGGQPFPRPLAAPGFDFGPVEFTKPLLMANRPGQLLDDEDVHAVADRESWQTSVVNLQHEEADLWGGLRRSYKNLIRQADKRFCIAVYGAGTMSRPPIEQARQLHITSAGRETRPAETWAMMGRWMQEGHGLLALAKSFDGTPKAYAFAIRYKDWSYYASGASMEQNVSHALIWHLMRVLRHDGDRRYFEVGWLARAGDEEKDKGISHFKEGFGGTSWTIEAMRKK